MRSARASMLLQQTVCGRPCIFLMRASSIERGIFSQQRGHKPASSSFVRDVGIDRSVWFPNSQCESPDLLTVTDQRRTGPGCIGWRPAGAASEPNMVGAGNEPARHIGGRRQPLRGQRPSTPDQLRRCFALNPLPRLRCRSVLRGRPACHRRIFHNRSEICKGVLKLLQNSFMARLRAVTHFW